MKVARRYKFHAYHSLPGVKDYDKPHEHDYTVEVVVDGALTGDKYGWIVDTAVVDAMYEPLCENLHDTDLNGWADPSTVENLARRFRAEGPDQLQARMTVTVWEDDDRWGQAP